MINLLLILGGAIALSTVIMCFLYAISLIYSDDDEK